MQSREIQEADALEGASKEGGRPAKSWRVSSGSVKRHIETEQKRRDRINDGCAKHALHSSF